MWRYRLEKERERNAEQVRALQDELERRGAEIARKDAENQALQRTLAEKINAINYLEDEVAKLHKDLEDEVAKLHKALDDKEDEAVKLKKDLRDKSKQYQVRTALRWKLHRKDSRSFSLLITLIDNCLGSRGGL